MDARVVAITINYFGADITARCALSLVGQVDRIIVIDNSDDDGEARRLSSALLQTLGADNQYLVKLASANKNLGFGQGVEMGVRMLGGIEGCDAVLLINNDAVACSGMIDALLRVFESHGGDVILAPKAAAGSVPAKLWYQRMFGLVAPAWMPGAFEYLNGACLLIPRKHFMNGLFDPDFFMYGEDVEFAWRMRRNGVAQRVVSDACYVHEGGASSQAGSIFYEQHVALGHLLLARKLTSGVLVYWFFLGGRMVSLTMRAIIRGVRFRSFNPWRGLWRAWRGRSL